MTGGTGGRSARWGGMKGMNGARRIGCAAALGLAVLAAGCNRAEEKRERALDARARRSHFEPPASISRAEFGGMVERRFHAMDRDGDGYLSSAEWSRRPDRFRREDTNGDGQVSADEFGHAALARFDRRDMNHDGTVTQPEWLVARQRRAAALAAGNATGR